MRSGRPHVGSTFIAADGAGPSAPVARWDGTAALALVALAVVLVGVGHSLVTRTLFPLAAALGAVVFAARSALSRRTPVERRGLLVDDAGIRLVTGGTEPAALLLALDRPFGLTLLCDRVRRRLVLAVTTGAQTLYVGATVAGADRRTLHALLARACTLPDDELALEPVALDGRPLDVPVRELARLLDLLERRDARAASRCFLSDVQGTDVVLDGEELHVGRTRFRLDAPLEWRALLFQEAIGSWSLGVSDTDPRCATPAGAVLVYQATWVRQAGAEAVLVALLPSLAGAGPAVGPIPAGDGPELHRALLRDQRLMQAMPDEPPPRELRVAIERPYMLPLRAALDRAPRAERSETPEAAAR